MKKTKAAGTMPGSLKKLVEKMGEMISHAGLDPMIGEVWATLAFEEHPLTVSQIAALLGLSESKLGKAITEAESWGVVKKAAAQGGGEAWTPELNPLKVTVKVLREREEPILKTVEALIGDALKDGSLPSFAKGRLKMMEELIRVNRVIYEIIIAICQLDIPLMKRARDLITTLTSGMGGFLGSLTKFGGRR